MCTCRSILHTPYDAGDRDADHQIGACVILHPILPRQGLAQNETHGFFSRAVPLHSLISGITHRNKHCFSICPHASPIRKESAPAAETSFLPDAAHLPACVPVCISVCLHVDVAAYECTYVCMCALVYACVRVCACM